MVYVMELVGRPALVTLPSFSRQFNTQMGCVYESKPEKRVLSAKTGLLFSLHFSEHRDHGYPLQFSCGTINDANHVLSRHAGAVPVICHDAQTRPGASGAPLLCVYNTTAVQNRYLIGVGFGGRTNDFRCNYAVPHYREEKDDGGTGAILGLFVSILACLEPDHFTPEGLHDTLFDLASKASVTILCRHPTHAGVLLFPSPVDQSKSEQDILKQHPHAVAEPFNNENLFAGYEDNGGLRIARTTDGRCSPIQHYEGAKTAWFLGENYLKTADKKVGREAIFAAAGLSRGAIDILNFVSDQSLNKTQYWKQMRSIDHASTTPLRDTWTHFGYCGAVLRNVSTNEQACALMAAANWKTDESHTKPAKWICTTTANQGQNRKNTEHTEIFCCDRLFEWIRYKKPVRFDIEAAQRVTNAKRGNRFDPPTRFSLTIRFDIQLSSPCDGCVGRINQLRNWLHTHTCCLFVTGLPALTCKLDDKGGCTWKL